MYQIWKDDDGTDYIHGVGIVVLSKEHEHPPYFEKNRSKVCNFNAEVTSVRTPEDDEKGHPIFKKKYMKFSAFSRTAKLCRNFETGDRFIFYGRLVVDDYWTRRNNTGEIQYKVLLDACIPQITEEYLLSTLSENDIEDKKDPAGYYGGYDYGPDY